MAVAGCFCATKGKMNFGAYSGRVDVKDAGVGFVHGMKSAINILSINCCRQSIAHAVGDVDRFFERAGGNHRRNWSEDFLLRDAHVRSYISEDSWLDEKAVRIFTSSQTTAAASEFCLVLAPANLDVTEDLLHCFFINHGPHFGVWPGAVPHPQAFGTLNQLARELLVHFLVDHQT